MKNKKISITTYSVEKITVSVQKIRLKPVDSDEVTSRSVDQLLLDEASAEFQTEEHGSNKGEPE
jgi:hypothetical protein